MELVRELREMKNKKQSRNKSLHRGREIEEIPDNQLTIELPDFRVLRVIARSAFLALIIITFPRFGSILMGSSSSYSDVFEPDMISDQINGDLFLILFQDLINEGFIKSGDKALFVNNGAHQISIRMEMNLCFKSDFENQNSVPSDTFDFAFALGFHSAKFIDRTLKIGGIAVFQLSYNPSDAFRKPLNFEIVHLRQFESNVVAMRKTGPVFASKKLWRKNKRRCAFASEAKMAALKGLEEVLLEPPRRNSIKSNEFLKRMKFLPDLMDDSLERYPRRVFIDVNSPDGEGGNVDWFKRIYPTKNQDFEVYEIDTVTELTPEKGRKKQGMSEWMKMNVGEDEYVVMKVEAELVEEMVMSRAICLVDELFLECKYQGMGMEEKKKKKRRRRAYWECLALYGRLRDEGVAVHQWWS